MTFRFASGVLLTALTVWGRLLAAELGDPAPPIQISEWVKGQPVNLADGKGKKVYVVEFWATWCPPCRASIPHLTELQKKFKDKDVVFVGVTTEKPDVVRKFVDQMGNKMDYVVAIDKDDGTSDGYMKAFGANGIPHAFVVDKEGKFAWQGHPMAELEQTLQEVIDGKYNIEKSKKRDRAQKLLQDYYRMVAQEQTGAKLDELAKELETLGKEGALPEGKPFDPEAVKKQLRFQTLVNKYRQALMADADEAKLDELAKQVADVAPPQVKMEDFRTEMQLQALYVRYMEKVAKSADGAGSEAIGEKLLTLAGKKGEILNEIAWTILTDKRIKHRDTAFALKVAKAACEATDNKAPQILDTYARALFDSGKVAEAVAQQKKAIGLAADADREQMTATLKEYEAKLGK